MAQPTREERLAYLAERVEIVDGHHVWQNATDRVGIPKARDGARTMGAHRLAFEAFYGVTLTFQDVVVVTCDEPLCVNPEHMALAVRADLMRRGLTCKRGHPVNEENIGPIGCRPCRRITQKERLRKRREARQMT